MNLFSEKEYLKQYRRSIQNSNILLIEGRHSLENLLYKDHAPDSERGILSIESALLGLGIKVRTMASTDQGINDGIEWADIVFIYAHGEFGEDGRLQGFIDYKAKKYPGSGVLASAVCADKVVLKQIALSQGLRTPRFYTAEPSIDHWMAAMARAQFPVMVKPRTGGSSIGIRKFDTPDALAHWISCLPPEVLSSYFIEEFVEGSFMTVGIIELSEGVLALPVLRVLTSSDFYDEATKLGADEARGTVTYEVPAHIPADLTTSLQDFALKAFRCAQCDGLARVDLMVDRHGVPTLLEINTIPGMSPNSNFTKAFCSLGFTYEELVLAALRTARSNAPRDAMLGAFLEVEAAQMGADDKALSPTR